VRLSAHAGPGIALYVGELWSHWIRPRFTFSLEPSYGLNQIPKVPSINTRVSAVQLERPAGVNPLLTVGAISVKQPVLLNMGDP